MIKLSVKPVNGVTPTWWKNLWDYYGSWSRIKRGLLNDWNGVLSNDPEDLWECVCFENEKDAILFILRWT